MKTTKWLSLLLALTLILSAALTGCAEKAPESAPVSMEAAPASGDFSYTAKAEDISEYGNVQLSVTCTDFLALGFAFGDVVTVSFLDENLQLPVCSNYSDVDSGTAGLFARDADEYVSLAINMGDFASACGIAERASDSDTWNYCEGVTGPVSFSISLHEPCGYYGEYVLHQL